MNRTGELIAVDCESIPWSRAALPNGEPKGVTYRVAFPGGAGVPHVTLSRYDPHWTEARHRHLEDECLMLAEGEIEIGGVLHRAPAVVFVPRGVLYGPLTAGPQGVTFYRLAYTKEMLAPTGQESAAPAG